MAPPRHAAPRPRPLLTAFRTVGGATAFAGALITTFVTYGLLTPDQGSALGNLTAAVPGLVALVTAVGAAWGVVRQAEPQVTPVESPAVEGPTGDLIPLIPDTSSGDHR